MRRMNHPVKCEDSASPRFEAPPSGVLGYGTNQQAGKPGLGIQGTPGLRWRLVRQPTWRRLAMRGLPGYTRH